MYCHRPFPCSTSTTDKRPESYDGIQYPNRGTLGLTVRTESSIPLRCCGILQVHCLVVNSRGRTVVRQEVYIEKFDTVDDRIREALQVPNRNA